MAFLVLTSVGCTDTPTGTDAGIDAPTAVLNIVSERAPVIACNQFSWCFDVRQDATRRVSGLPASAFTYSLQDTAGGVSMAVQNTCFAELAGDGGQNCYALCLGSDLVSDQGYVLGITAAVDGGTVSASTYFRTSPPADAGIGMDSGCIPNPRADAGTPDGAADGTGGTDAGLDAE